MSESRAAWAFMVKVASVTLIGGFTLIALFYDSCGTKKAPPQDDILARARRRDEEAARAALEASAAASASRLEAERRAVEARLRRARLRADIYRALGKKPPEATRKDSAKRTLPKSSPVPLDKKYIQERIREDFVPLAKTCYEALLAKNPTARGKAVFSFVIVGDPDTGGIVESAELVEGTTLSEPEFSYCVAESLLSVSFEPPPKGGWVTVTYPIDFSPDEPSSDADAGTSEPDRAAAPATTAAKLPRAFKAEVVDVTAREVPQAERNRLRLSLGPPMQSCYVRASDSNPDARGVLSLLIDADKGGTIASVDAHSGLGERFAECARRAVRNLGLPNAERWKNARVGVTVNLTYSE